MWNPFTKACCAMIIVMAFSFMIGFPPTAGAQWHSNPPKEETSTKTLVIIAAVGLAVIATLLIIKHHKKAKEKEEEEDSGEDSDSTSSQFSYPNSRIFAGSGQTSLQERLFNEKENTRVKLYLGVRSDDADRLMTRKSDFHFSDQTIVAGVSLEF